MHLLMPCFLILLIFFFLAIENEEGSKQHFDQSPLPQVMPFDNLAFFGCIMDSYLASYIFLFFFLNVASGGTSFTMKANFVIEDTTPFIEMAIPLALALGAQDTVDVSISH